METLDEQLKHMHPLQKRRLVRQLKARFLRELSQRQFIHADLLEIFGLCIKHKIMAPPTRHQMPGRHHAGSKPSAQNPAGTKFVRQCIRRSGKESQYNRELYATMAGEQYAH